MAKIKTDFIHSLFNTRKIRRICHEAILTITEQNRVCTKASGESGFIYTRVQNDSQPPRAKNYSSVFSLLRPACVYVLCVHVCARNYIIGPKVSWRSATPGGLQHYPAQCWREGKLLLLWLLSHNCFGFREKGFPVFDQLLLSFH